MSTVRTENGYDAYGNQTSSAPAVNLNTASTYDLADRLISITPPGQAATSYTYDALGRVGSRVTPAGTDAYEYVGTSQTAWRSSRGGVATSSAIDPSGARLATIQSGTTGYLLADLHANLAAVVNAGETALLSATRYDPFGQTVAAADSGGSFPTPWRFQGRLDLSPDNHPLYAFGARTYDPGSGAFTSLDAYAGSPGDPLSLNRFAYAEANPWTLVDPDGHRPCADLGGSCQASSAANSQLAQNQVQAAAQAAQVNAIGCRHAGDCTNRSSAPSPAAPPGYVWSTSTIAGGQRVLLPAQCAETADRYVGAACKRDAGSDLLLAATGILLIATGGEVAAVVVGGSRILLAQGAAAACAMYCERAQNFVSSLIEGFGAAPVRSVTPGSGLGVGPGAMSVDEALGAEDAGGMAFFRGAQAGEAPNFVPRPGEFRVDPETGFVRSTHGLSVFDNPESVISRGFDPYRIDPSSVPSELRFIQRGRDPTHYEIVPRPGMNLTPLQFVCALAQIRCG